MIADPALSLASPPEADPGTAGLQQVFPSATDGSPAAGPPRRRKAGRTRRQTGPTEQDADPSRQGEPWGPVQVENDPLLRALESEPAVLCSLLMLRAALLREPAFLQGAMRRGVVSIVHVPGKDWGRCAACAWDMIVDAWRAAPPDGFEASFRPAVVHRADRSAGGRRHDGPNVVRVDQFMLFERSSRPTEDARPFAEALANGRAIHVFSQDPDALLAPEMLVAEEQRLVVAPLSGDILYLLANGFRTEGAWPPPPAHRIPRRLKELAAACTPFLINAAFGPSGTCADFIRRLGMVVERQAAVSPRTVTRTAATLDDLPGLGEVGQWGRRIAADLMACSRGQLAWSEMERGMVLEGPPGTGKSSLARALAGSAGVPLITASLAQWQGHREGHLGHLLSAMHATFAQARKAAPCIVLVDEIDSFPTRSAVAHSYRDYVVEVVNAFLEQLDGAVERQGVFVIGTCNDASRLDPALLRSGRLERVMRLERPSVGGMEDILRVHLHDALRDEDLRQLAATAVARHAVGADAECWCRGARRRARVAGRPMVLSDLAEEVGPSPPLWPAEALRRTAVHEAGHALSFVRLGAGVLQRVMVDHTTGAGSVTTADGQELFRGMSFATLEVILTRLGAALAGRAAEEIILGAPSGGAGGSCHSDLARATRAACQVIASSGLDDHPDAPVFMGAADDQKRLDQLLLLPDFRQRVAGIVRQAYSDALSLMRDHRAAVERIADALVERGTLSGPEVETLLRQHPFGETSDGRLS